MPRTEYDKFDKPHFLYYLTTIYGISVYLKFKLEKLIILICDMVIVVVQYINFCKCEVFAFFQSNVN